MSKIAIIYGSRYGGTRDIAEYMAKKLEERGKEVLLVDAKDKKKVQAALESEPKSFIIGSGIEISKWTRPMVNFIKKYKDKLVDAKLLAMFVSCGTAKDEAGAKKACDEYVFEFASGKGLEPKLLAAFGGVYDFSENSPLKGLKKGMIKKMLENEEPGKFDLEGINDQRNWESIDEFVGKILEIA